MRWPSSPCAEGQLRRLEARGGSGQVLARLAREPNRFLATIQIGITLAGFLASATAAVTLAEPLEAPLGFLDEAARPIAIVVVTLLLAYLTLVFGELPPSGWPCSGPSAGACWWPGRWPSCPPSTARGMDAVALDQPGRASWAGTPNASARGQRGGAS